MHITAKKHVAILLFVVFAAAGCVTIQTGTESENDTSAAETQIAFELTRAAFDAQVQEATQAAAEAASSQAEDVSAQPTSEPAIL